MITDLSFINEPTLSLPPFPHITTKLQIPSLPPTLVKRPRLNQQLNQCIQYKLLLVAAPAGFGKTTLLSEWSQRSEWPVAWVSLDAADNDPIHFWSYIITALDKLDANICCLLPLLHSSRPDFKYILTGLVNVVTNIPDHFVLILDDYHYIENEAIHETLAFLLDYLPTRMHLILASRLDPPLPLARWRARGQLVELRADDLRFSDDEAQTLLNQAANVSLSADEVTIFQERTEGWAAGLHLAALTVEGLSEATAINLLHNFRGDHPYIVDYLAAEVLQQQPETLRTFLLQTTILDYLHADLCDAVMERHDSHLILEQLEQRNLFIIPLDTRRHTYRYHHLFADFLLDQLQQIQPDKLPTLHRKAADWYEQQDEIDRAIKHTLAAENFTDATHLIEKVAEQRLMRGEINTLLNWFELLPEEVIRTRPTSCIYYAWALTHAGQLERASQYLDAFDQFETAQVETLKGQKAAVQARMAVIRGNPTQIINFSKQALALLPTDNLALRSEVSLDLAFAQDQTPHNFEAACQAFEEAIAIGRLVSPRVAMMASYYLASSHMIHGQFQQAAQLYHQGLQWSQRSASSPVSACWMHVGLGILLYEWNNLTEALDHLQQGLELARQSGEVKVLIYGPAALARLWQTQGQPDKALTALQTAENIAQQTNIISMIDDLAVNRVILWLRQSQVETAANWVQTRGFSLDPQMPRSFENSILIRLAIAQSQGHHSPLSDEIMALLNQRREMAQTNGEIWELVRNLILLALAYHAQGHERQALDTLDEALTLAQPSGLIRTFVDEGPAAASLLRKYASRNTATDYATQLLTACGEDTTFTIIPLPTELPAQPLIEPLRQRELEVLQLISTGRSNKEIADEMILAVSTVKWHLKNIYGKLQVNNRTQALARARELNLL